MYSTPVGVRSVRNAQHLTGREGTRMEENQLYTTMSCSRISTHQKNY